MTFRRKITDRGICSYHLTEEEFELLPYLDARIYLSSSFSRFESWKSSFDENHTDWQDRVLVQRQLAQCFGQACDNGDWQPPEEAPTHVLFLGASLGSVATLFFYIEWLKRFPAFDPQIHILDYLYEPLTRTKEGNFEISEQALRDCGSGCYISELQYKRLLGQSLIYQGNIVELPPSLPGADIVIAPYIHHHLNIIDKERACAEMSRVTKPGGLALVGDLSFDWIGYNQWLERHQAETVPYAVESFISQEAHRAYFSGMRVLASARTAISYAFCAKQG